MSTLVQDPYTARALIAERRRKGINLHDEVWEGVYYVMPNPDVEHQDLIFGVGIPLRQVVLDSGRGRVFPGVNVSDRVDD